MRRLGATFDGAVVATVSMTLALVIVELKVTLAGDTLQLLSDGKPVHCGTRLKVPISPFIAVSINIVLPGWPGFVTVIVLGFATIAKSGPGFTVTAPTPNEPA
jgi:hypothetical protein